MEAIEGILSRHSYRGKYRDEAVANEVLKTIMEAGLSAPSGCNKQTVSLIAVNKPELMKEILGVIDPPIAESAPAAIFVLSEKIIAYRDKCYSTQDYSAAIENMLIAANAMGYSSCWYEGHLTDEDRLGRKIADILKVPEKLELVCMLPIGIAAEDNIPVKKKPYSGRMSFNGYK